MSSCLLLWTWLNNLRDIFLLKKGGEEKRLNKKLTYFILLYCSRLMLRGSSVVSCLLYLFVSNKFVQVCFCEERQRGRLNSAVLTAMLCQHCRRLCLLHLYCDSTQVCLYSLTTECRNCQKKYDMMPMMSSKEMSRQRNKREFESAYLQQCWVLCWLNIVHQHWSIALYLSVPNKGFLLTCLNPTCSIWLTNWF